MTSPEAIRAIARDLPLDERRRLASGIASDLALTERMSEQADWFFFRLRGAMSKR